MRILYYSWDVKMEKNYPEAIRNLGIQLEVTSDEKEVIKRLEARSFDLLIFDATNVVNYKKLFQYKKEDDYHLVYLAITTPEDTFILEDALECGLNDYVFDFLTIPQFTAKLKAFLFVLTQERKYTFTSVLRAGDLELNPLTREARRGNKLISLTNKEYRLLELLMLNKNKIVTREQINDCIWQGEYERNIEGVYIAFLRRKLEKDFPTKIINTIRNVGYIIKD